MTAQRPVETAASQPYLLISRVGPDSLHWQWLGDQPDRGFDVLLSSYDQEVTRVRAPGVAFEYRPGTKVAGYGEILREHADRIRQYRYVALFDDDLATDPASLRRLFEIAERQRLKIAQPALDHQSYFTYACLLRHKDFALRHVNFVEMMCPFFRSDVLLALAPLFELGFESGIDLVWSALVHEGPRDFAVIDSVSIRHTRPVGSIKAVNGFVGDRIYETDIEAILQLFGLSWLPALPYGGLRTDGRYTDNRLALALSASRLVSAVPIRSARFRAKAVATYLNQIVRERARNEPARWPPVVRD